MAAQAAPVVGIAIKNRVVEIEDQTARVFAQPGKLPARQKPALQNDDIELRGTAVLEQAAERASLQRLERKRPALGVERRFKRPQPISAADMVG